MGARKFVIEPGAGIQLFHFLHTEIGNKPVSFRHPADLNVAVSIGKSFLNIGGALQTQIVQANQNTLFAHLQILLDVVSALLDGQTIGLKRMLRRIPRGPSMSNQTLLVVGSKNGHLVRPFFSVRCEGGKMRTPESLIIQ